MWRVPYVFITCISIVQNTVVAALLPRQSSAAPAHCYTPTLMLIQTQSLRWYRLSSRLRPANCLLQILA